VTILLTRTAATNVGLVRPINEDNYVCLDAGVFAVADGMGGHAAGEVASGMMVSTIKELIMRQPEINDLLAPEALREIIMEANERILQKSSLDKNYAGMGTTASILYIKSDRGFFAHVGDSRIYLFRDESIQQITKDHSLVWDLVENGTITRAEAKQHPKRNLLTRAVGVDADLKVDFGDFSVKPTDKFLLCSDGLTNMISDDEIRATVCNPSIEDKAGHLIGLALQAGGTDNITAIVVENNHV
jgi:PPM family protein phosphatase